MHRLRFWLLRIVVAALFLLKAAPAQAYPWMIRHEYTTCNQCHADPSGGGLLTAYGRMQGTILLASNYKGGAAEEQEPGTIGDFLFGAIKLPESGSVLLQPEIRTARLYTRDLDTGADDSRTLIMQADLLGQIRVDRFRANGGIGFVNSGARGASITKDTALGGDGNAIVSRTHWVGVDLGKDEDTTVRAGRINLPYGIRSIEHTAWVRSTTRTDINASQQYGIALAHNEEKYRFEAMAIAGNFSVSPDLYRERGFVGFAEWFAKPNLALGASALITLAGGSVDNGTRADTRRTLSGLTMRWAVKKALVISSETDLTFATTRGLEKKYGFAGLVQADLEPWQGLHFLAMAETKNLNLGTNLQGFGGWLGAQWFFFPHFDIRGDVVVRTEDSGSGSRFDSLAFLAQLHAYL